MSEQGTHAEPRTAPEAQLPPDHDVLLAIRTAKGTLTRRLNAFRALTQRDFTRQELVAARDQLLASVQILEAELVTYVELGLDPQADVFRDGQERAAEIHGPMQHAYEELLADFLTRDGGSTPPSNAAELYDEELDVTASISATEAHEIREQLNIQNQLDLRALRRDARERQRL